MKKILIIILILKTTLFSQSPYTTEDQQVINNFIKIYPYIGREHARTTKQLINYDYIHDNYKRVEKKRDTNRTELQYQLSTIKVHMDLQIQANFDRGTVSLPHAYLSVEKTFFPLWALQITPFITADFRYDNLKPNEKQKPQINLYDAGIQMIGMSRILLSMRTRAVNDVSATTFMLMPSVVHYDSVSQNTPHWYLPRVDNAPGIRAGFISHYYELVYSQGFTEDYSPLAAIMSFNLSHLKVSALYQYANQQRFLDIDNKTEKNGHLFQLSAATKIPFLNEKLWFNVLAEYTFTSEVVHYIRTEFALEYSIFNLAIRPMFYITQDENDAKDLFLFEYSAFIKYNYFSFGFQGSTDGRYNIAGKVIF